MRPASTIARLPELLPEPEGEFAYAVFEGLSKPQKTLPCRFFYDARGSELFEEITRLARVLSDAHRSTDPARRTRARWRGISTKAAC